MTATLRPAATLAHRHGAARLLLAGGLAAGIAGCSAVSRIEPPPPPIEPPPSYTAAPNSEPAGEPAAAPAADWWSELDDRQLDALVAEALEHNWDLAAAAARVEAAIASARIRGADLSPQAGVGLSSRRARQNFIGFPIPGREDSVLSTTSTNSGLSLSVSWEADLWGRLRARRASAVHEGRAVAADLAAARLSIAGQVARAYFSLVELGQQVGLAEQTLASRERTLERVDARYARGLAPSLELRLARTQRDAVAAALSGRRAELDRAKRQLELLVGRYPAAALQTAGDLPSLRSAVPPGLPAELLSRRPDLVAAEERVYAALAEVGAARASLLPQLSLTGTGGTASGDLADLLDTDLSVWSLAANLLQPLFQGGRLRAGVDLADAGRDQASAAWAQTVLRAFTEVETALAAEGLLAERVEALASAAEEARRAAELAENRYLAGLSDYLSVLESQRQAFDSQSLLLSGRLARLLARVDLVLALGGGFEAERPGAGTPRLDTVSTGAPAAPASVPVSDSDFTSPPSSGDAAGARDEVPDVR